jgi:hypothetical protein
MDCINRPFVAKYLEVLLVERIGPVDKKKIFYKTVYNHHQHIFICVFIISSYRAACFGHKVVIFRSLNYIKMKLNCDFIFYGYIVTLVLRC